MTIPGCVAFAVNPNEGTLFYSKEVPGLGLGCHSEPPSVQLQGAACGRWQPWQLWQPSGAGHVGAMWQPSGAGVPLGRPKGKALVGVRAPVVQAFKAAEGAEGEEAAAADPEAAADGEVANGGWQMGWGGLMGGGADEGGEVLGCDGSCAMSLCQAHPCTPLHTPVLCNVGSCRGPAILSSIGW